eukprot:TRINITY_DN2009_c0_g2_i1.p1 TRINITY_DN2009_c0_g2~~TRINITY_DN2009_c0_g2_i1.p1  ORF type:complete len:732 (-),score=59.93 TRINITY_DN2009_c0_g2_i1:813-2768(-)
MAQTSSAVNLPVPEERPREEAINQATKNSSMHQNSSLYVGDLDPSVTEAQLFELFSQAGPVHSIRLCRDAITRSSLGYAYINYNTTLDSHAPSRALSTLNYTSLNGKPLRIMWSHRDPSFRKSGVGNIFIKNLDKTIDHKALHDTFSAFGSILSCKVALDLDGSSKGYGFVHFETQDAADLAVTKVNNMKLRDRVVFVGHFLPRKERPHDKQNRFTNIFVKNLPLSYNDEKLRKLFEPHGTIQSAVVMTDVEGTSRGFGFVNFESTECAAVAVEQVNETELEGHKVFCARAQKRGEREVLLTKQFQEKKKEKVSKFYGMNLYIKNLSDEVDDELLREQFEKFGDITSTKVMVDDQGKSKGFGFICFGNRNSAGSAMKEMRGKLLKGKPLYISLAQTKEVRQAQLKQHFNTMTTDNSSAYTTPAPFFYNNLPNNLSPSNSGSFYNNNGFGNYNSSPFNRRNNRPRSYDNLQGFGYNNNNRGNNNRNFQPRRQNGNGNRGGRYNQNNGRPRSTPSNDGVYNNVYQQPGVYYKPSQMMAPAPAPFMIPAVQPAPVAPAVVQQAPPVQQKLTSSVLSQAPPDQQKQMLGEALFPLVSRLQPGLAGKITGMLLEMDNNELLILMESSEQLVSKVSEAIDVLKQHNAIPDLSLIREM